MKNLESTFKDRDVEEIIDIYFTRPIGYLFARMSKSLNLSPNMITMASMILGVISGHLFYYSTTTINIVGIFTKLISNFLDSADGQLARMTNSCSNMGRMLDGISGHVIYISIYLHICFRYIHEGGSLWIYTVAVAAGFSHIIQCAWEDCYRNGYLYFVRGPNSNETNNSISLNCEYNSIGWKDGFLQKLFIYLELKYTRFLELISKSFQELKDIHYRDFRKKIPSWLAKEYKSLNKPMMKYYNILTINVRQYTLFLFLLLKKPELFFIFELVVLNSIFLYAAIRQENINKRLILFLMQKRNTY